MSARAVALVLASAAALAAGCGGPLHLADDHVTSAARIKALDIRALTCEPVTTFGVVAPGGIQGLTPTIAHALTTSLSRTKPPVRVVPMPETLSRLADNGLAGEYGDLLAGFARAGMLEGDRLKRIGGALGSRYVLQPGLAEFSQSLFDKFEFWGIKIVRTRIATLRLWLQIWEAPTGHLLWERTGELTTSVPVFQQDTTMSLDDMAQKLWALMLETDLFDGLPLSQSCT
ncbi:MAG TPA: hypothetical protein VIG37_30865 [Methylomirabilota bacterium]|jgi:hypothetical protein